jgi:hypothetical protein
MSIHLPDTKNITPKIRREMLLARADKMWHDLMRDVPDRYTNQYAWEMYTDAAYDKYYAMLAERDL